MCLQYVYWNVTPAQSATSTTQPNSANVSTAALGPIHPTKFVTIMSRSIFPSFFIFLSSFYLSYFFSRFCFLPVLYTFLQLPLSLLVSFPIMKSAPSSTAKHNMHADGSDIQTPSNDENSNNTKTLQCKPRNTLPHTVPVSIRKPTWVTSSIEPTINENVLPLTSTAELSFTQALTYLATNRRHQIYGSTQQVTSSQGHAMAREHQWRYSHHSCRCHQQTYSGTGDKTPLRSQLRTAKSNWK